VLRSLSRSRKEPHNFGGVAAATPCGSGSDGSGSKPDDRHRGIIKKPQTILQFLNFYQFKAEKIGDKIYLTLLLAFACFNKVGLVKSRGRNRGRMGTKK
jgi:hypothetical protein